MSKKEILLREAKSNVENARKSIVQEIQTTEKTIERYEQPGQTDQFVQQKLLTHFHERLDQLHHLFPSPFFFRGDITHTDGKIQTIHFAKFPLISEGIFSWTSPAARLRFADLGPITYTIPDQGTWSGTLSRKDQFMIAGGEIRFMTSETAKEGRTLVYQEQLSKRKTDFMLPEIIARMERAQDDVIRAEAQGSFLISGPAGSGKTTLAFHRIAYLLQSPEHAAQFSDDNIIVFVQDENTRAYFSKLLPELGIHQVNVTTFFAWACEQLHINNASFVRRQNGTNIAIDTHEHHKLLALRKIHSCNHKNPFAALGEAYAPFFSPEDMLLFEEQKRTKTFDRFDITLLLNGLIKQEGKLKKEEEYFERKKEFEVMRKKRKIPLSYAFIVIDEVQNYLPEQINILRSCISKDTNAMLYVGDLRQQILLGTLTTWEEASESFTPERKVELEKVYRSTKRILSFINDLGFATSIPDGMRDGQAVQEEHHENETSELQRIKEISREPDDKLQTGIIGFSEEYLEIFKKELTHIPHFHIMTAQQAQGVEFDRVFLVGIAAEMLISEKNIPQELEKNLKKIRKDLLYVALTRAIEELYIFGKVPLKTLASSLL